MKKSKLGRALDYMPGGLVEVTFSGLERLKGRLYTCR